MSVTYTDSGNSKGIMEDKRIVKTKRALRQALIELLADTPFEEITITNLCKTADISRITFYTHYSDKYDLADDIFKEMIASGTELYNRLQQSNNPGNDPVTSYCNVLDSIMDTYYNNFDFFHQTSPHRNYSLASTFYHYVLETVEMHARKERNLLMPKYSTRKVTGFLCLGLLGFINECHGERSSLEQIRAESKEILRGILESEILTKRGVIHRPET